jgi:inhibitor of KinA sporulation pathway (predicted exonuclease)
VTLLVTSADAEIDTWPTSGEVVILDLEWTAWAGSLERRWSEPWEFREVIAIGAVRVDGGGFRVRSEFETFVRPIRNPRVSEYISELTGITDDILTKHGIFFPEALSRFAVFADDASVLANGSDGSVLMENCRLNGIDSPLRSDQVRTIRSALAIATGRTSSSLVSADLPQILGIGPPNERHGALSDARAVAAALSWLRRIGRI